MTWQHVTLGFLPLLGYIIHLVERRRAETRKETADAVQHIKKRMDAMETTYKEFLGEFRMVIDYQTKKVEALTAEKWNKR